MKSGVDSFATVFSRNSNKAISDFDAHSRLLDRIIYTYRSGLEPIEIDKYYCKGFQTLTRSFSRAFLLLIIFLSFSLFTEGINRALIIGIDIYLPGNVTKVNSERTSWINLDGCVNDAM